MLWKRFTLTSTTSLAAVGSMMNLATQPFDLTAVSTGVALLVFLAFALFAARSPLVAEIGGRGITIAASITAATASVGIASAIVLLMDNASPAPGLLLSTVSGGVAIVAWGVAYTAAKGHQQGPSKWDGLR